MHNIKDDIKIVDGDKRITLKAKLLKLKRDLGAYLTGIKWQIYIILNRGRF